MMYGLQDKRFAAQSQMNPIEEKTRSERKISPLLVRVSHSPEKSFIPSFAIEDKSF